MPRKSSALNSWPKRSAEFIQPIECLAVTKLAAAPQWNFEIKLDGYRAIAVKSAPVVNLFSRRRKSLNRQFPSIVEALHDLPEGTVLDGEIVALDDAGRPNFHLLQRFRSEGPRIRYSIFDLLIYKDRDLTQLPLGERRELLKSAINRDSPRIRISEQF